MRIVPARIAHMTPFRGYCSLEHSTASSDRLATERRLSAAPACGDFVVAPSDGCFQPGSKTCEGEPHLAHGDIAVEGRYYF